MSSFWKKFKGNKAEQSQKSGVLAPLPSSETTFKKPPILITQADEEPYLNPSVFAVNDPLQIKSQIIKSFEVLLKECCGLPHFLEFLQACEVEQYAECWLECDKFRALALSLLKKFRDKEESKPPQNGPCMSTNECRELDHKSINNNLTNIPQRKDSGKCNGMVLPDLVSNIPNDVSVTPIPSPEEPSSESSMSNEASPHIKSSTSPRLSSDEAFEQPWENENKSLNMCSTSADLEDETDNESLSSIENTRQRLLNFASKIYQEFIDGNSTKSIDLPEDIRAVVLDSLMSSEVDCNIFNPVQEYVYKYLEKEYHPRYLESEYFLKHIVEIFTSQKITLQDILTCETVIPYLMEYMEQEDGQPLIEFWISTSNFKEHLERQKEKESYNSEEAQSDAMVLYEKYFSLQATHKLGFSDQVRFIVECNICHEKGPTPHCFDVPLRIVHDVIQRDYLRGYLSSSLHIKFVSELVNTIKLSSFARKKRSASGSTLASEESGCTNKSSGMVSSISRSNTLLAMDSSVYGRGGGISSSGGDKLLKNIDDPSLALRIDSKQILDPDSLWRRKNFTKLSCGYVDELGRFESDLQPEPDRKMESKLSRTLKKFVKIEENKVKEDMAYKVAEMIVKDVTSITLRDQPRDRERRQNRPFSCTEEQLTNYPPREHLHRSSSEAMNLGSNSLYKVSSAGS